MTMFARSICDTPLDFSGKGRGPNSYKGMMSPNEEIAIQQFSYDPTVLNMFGNPAMRIYNRDEEGWRRPESKKDKIRVEGRAPSTRTIKNGEHFRVGIAVMFPDTPNMARYIERGHRVEVKNSHIFQLHRLQGTGTSGIEVQKGMFELEFGSTQLKKYVPVVYGGWNEFVLDALASTQDDGFVNWYQVLPDGVLELVYEHTGRNVSAVRADDNMVLNIHLGQYTGHMKDDADEQIEDVEYYFSHLLFGSGDEPMEEFIAPRDDVIEPPEPPLEGLEERVTALEAESVGTNARLEQIEGFLDSWNSGG